MDGIGELGGRQGDGVELRRSEGHESYQPWESDCQIWKEGSTLGSCSAETGRAQDVVIVRIDWSEIGSCARGNTEVEVGTLEVKFEEGRGCSEASGE